MVWKTHCPIWGEGHEATFFAYGESVDTGKFIIDEGN